MTDRPTIPTYPKRRLVVLGSLVLIMGLLIWRAVYLQVFTREFLQYQGDARHLRVVSVPSHRGMITDRRGEPLAISTPVYSVWVNPQEISLSDDSLARLAEVLDVGAERLRRVVAERGEREFVYARRHVNPNVAEQVRQLDLRGVFLQREYKRYYPAGEVAAHVVGFTDIDDQGQEGVELAYNDWLKGRPGKKRVVKDRLGRIVEDVERIRARRPGKDLTLSIDRRVQYLAYRELKKAVLEHKARSGSAVLLDARTGEVLALVNQPSYNANDRSKLRGDRYRNRAVTDVFEPGSTMKPFTIAAALESGKYEPTTPINTSPGTLKVGHDVVHDVHDHGMLDVAHVVIKSSNVGASKIALSLNPQRLWRMYNQVGFGSVTGSGFPGESAGLLTHYHRWHPIEQATLAFGYGLSATPLQLAQAYAVLASDGIRRPVTFLRVDEPVEGERVLSQDVAAEVRSMLEAVVSRQGTGRRAHVSGYRVAGKTGTVHKSTVGGYAEDRYISVFAGMAPASRPRLVLVVMINEPRNGEYYGGQVAAPVFARIMGGALRMFDVPPDDLPLLQTHQDQLREDRG